MIALSPEQLRTLEVLIGDYKRIVIENTNLDDETIAVRIAGEVWLVSSGGVSQKLVKG